MRTIRAADLFCGAGGTSTGVTLACEEMGYDLDLFAINHWQTAVDTHTKNHPNARHKCATLEGVDPNEMCPDGLDLLVASPECTHFSGAKGGQPRSNQSRASAWHVTHWAERLRPRTILIENVPEFAGWGPVTSDGKPIKAKKGRTFMAWISTLESLGYAVDYRTLVAADYGDPTSRRRLFIQAQLHQEPAWPAPTHSKNGGDLPTWRSAREIIDWSMPGDSIFGRKKALAPKTMARIAEGIRRFCGDQAKPFLLLMENGGVMPQGVDLEAMSASFVLSQGAGGAPRGVDQPVPTIPTKGAHQLVTPFIVPRYGERPTQAPRTHSIDAPLPTVPCTNQHALVQPFLTKYYGTGGAVSVDQPLDTVTTKARFALVEPRKMDILFRMLQPHELALAQGFDDYDFTGNKGEVVKQIGNAVPVHTARALAAASIN